MKTYTFLAIPFLVSFGALAQAQSDDYYRPEPVARVARPHQMVKFYQPTQTYYGKGYVVRYGYTTTTPSAAGYITSNAAITASSDQYLTVANSDSRRNITFLKKSVGLPAKGDQLSLREIQADAAQPTAPKPAAAEPSQPVAAQPAAAKSTVVAPTAPQPAPAVQQPKP